MSADLASQYAWNLSPWQGVGGGEREWVVSVRMRTEMMVMVISDCDGDDDDDDDDDDYDDNDDNDDDDDDDGVVPMLL